MRKTEKENENFGEKKIFFLWWRRKTEKKKEDHIWRRQSFLGGRRKWRRKRRKIIWAREIYFVCGEKDKRGGKRSNICGQPRTWAYFFISIK